MTPHYVSHGGELNWLLDDLVKRVAQVSRAVMLTQDGLAIGASAGLSREDAEHLAALASGFQSMARGAGQHFGGGLVRQTIIEMESAFLFVSAAGQGTCLAVLTTGAADVGLVAYEMAVLVRRSNEHLGVGARSMGSPPGASSGQRPPMAAGSGMGMPAPGTPQPMPPRPGAGPPHVPGGRTVPPSMSGTATREASMGLPPAPLPQLTPRPRDVPSAGSVYSPYPMPAGYPGPASYPE
jgi:predicted regulator of Ras-like GTPase activity (Roadblock/LC7/MglB family)